MFRFLYQKCLERICRAEEERRLRHSKILMEPSPDTLSLDKTSGEREGLDDFCPSVAPFPAVHAPQPQQMEPTPALAPQLKDPLADSLVPSPTASQRNSVRLGASPHRSAAASDILNWAAVQSHVRDVKSNLRDHNENSTHPSIVEHSASSSNDPTDALESGLGPAREPSSFISSSTHIAKRPLPAPPAPISEETREGPRMMDSGSVTSQTSENGIDDAVRRTRTGALKDFNADARSLRSNKSKTQLSHSDRFFEMAHPDSIGEVTSQQAGDKSAPHVNAGIKDGGVPSNGPQSCYDKLRAFKEFSGRMYKKSLPLLRQLFDGLYHVLVLGPHVAGGSEDGKGKVSRLLYLTFHSSLYLPD
jgi:hypothetical protein